MSKKIKSKFLQEKGKEVPTSQALEKVAGPVATVEERQSLAKAFPDAHRGTVRRLSLPPIVKPKDLIAEKLAIAGKVVRVVDSPNKSFASQLLVMEYTSPAGQVSEFCFPAVAVVRKSLETAFGSLEGTVGKIIGIRGLGNTKTQAGLPVNLFDVYEIEPGK